MFECLTIGCSVNEGQLFCDTCVGPAGGGAAARGEAGDRPAAARRDGRRRRGLPAAARTAALARAPHQAPAPPVPHRYVQ